MDEMTDRRKPEHGTGASPLSDAIEMVFQTKLPIRPQEPSLHDYYGDLRQPPRLAKYVRYHEEIIRFADFDPNGKDVLEVVRAACLEHVQLHAQDLGDALHLAHLEAVGRVHGGRQERDPRRRGYHLRE